MPPLLALVASLVWGSSDFAGSMLSRRWPSTAVVFLGTLMVFVVLALGIPLLHPPFGTYQLYGLGAGFAVGVGLACFYRAMAAGPMSLVAPLSATSAAVPVLWALARGGHVDAVQAAGIVLAFAGVILASGPELREGALVSRSTLLLTLISAIGFGLYYIFFALGSATSVYGTVLAQRAGGVLILAPVALRGIRAGTGPLRGLAFGASAVGLLLWSGFGDVTANALYGLATRHAGGGLPVVMALSGLYPVVSTLLARGLLKERLRPVQNLGILAAFTGVLLLNA
jgi:drug/metabolite transporter (DMT)-like permease